MNYMGKGCVLSVNPVRGRFDVHTVKLNDRLLEVAQRVQRAYLCLGTCQIIPGSLNLKGTSLGDIIQISNEPPSDIRRRGHKVTTIQYPCHLREP